MAIGVEFREIQNYGGDAQLTNNAVQRLADPPDGETVSFVLPPAAPYTARVFKVVVPTQEGRRPPAFRFLPAEGEDVRVIPDRGRGGVANLVPTSGENAYVFHEVLPGILMAYRESAKYPRGGGGSDSESEEEGDETMTEYGTVDEDGNLTIVNGVEQDPVTGAITFGSNNVPAGALPVDRNWQPSTQEGAVEVPVADKWRVLHVDPERIVRQFVSVPTNEGAPVVLPFFMRREEVDSSIYVVYLPANCMKYGGDCIEVDNVQRSSGDWYRITDIGAVNGNIWCFVVKEDGSLVAKFVKGTGEAVPSVADALTFFKVAKVDASVHDGLYGGIVQVAGGQEGLLPDDLADMKPGGGSIGSGDTRVPFLVYPDKGDESDGDDGAFMYLPAGSLTIDGVEVEFDGVADGYIPVEAGNSYWCEIFRVVGDSMDGGAAAAQVDDGGESSGGGGEEDGIRYMASISSDSEPSDGVVFRFRVTDVLDGVNCNQLVFGAVALGNLPDYRQLVAWQVVQISYEDSKTSKNLYRMFLPGNGALFYNGFSLPIEEADGGWYEMSEDIGTVDSTYRYYCVIYNLTAHLFTEDEYHDFVSAHLDEQANIQAQFLVAEVVTGNGGDDSDSGDDWMGKTVKALVVTTENGFFAGESHSRPGANADFNMWSSVFGAMTTADNIMHLADGQTGKAAVLNALDMVCGTEGLTIFMISTHGASSGSMEIYNDLLSPAELAAKFAQSPGPVWFIADCCFSGRAVTGASPSSSLAAKLVADVGEYLKANAPSVKYLGWACTQPDTVGWTMSDGSHFTKSCFRNISAGKTFAEVWTAVSTDPSVTALEIPTKVVANGFDELVPIIASPASESQGKVLLP